MAVKDKQLMRLPKQGQIAGVCAGLAQYFEIDVTLVRVAFVVLTFATSGGMLLAYLILAIVMPKPEEKLATAELKTDGKKATFSQNAYELVDEINVGDRTRTMRNYAGLGLIVLGLWLLLAQFIPDWVNFRWDYVWPIVVILIGFVVISRNRR